MQGFTLTQIMDAATQAFVNSRCGAAYLHDMKGELQTLTSCIELLTRATENRGGDLILKSSAIARRALATHERSLGKVFSQMTLDDEESSDVDLGSLLMEVLKLLRRDAAAKAVSFEVDIDEAVVVTTQAHRCRLAMLGLSVAMLDDACAEAMIEIRAKRQDEKVVISFCTEQPFPAPASIPDIFLSPEGSVRSLPLMLAQAAQWASTSGFELKVTATSAAAHVLSIDCPVSAVGVHRPLSSAVNL